MPNIIAYSAIALWPIISLIFFLVLERRNAVIWSILAAYLILPMRTSFDFPGVPPMDKAMLPNVAAFVFATLFAAFRPISLPRSYSVKAAMIIFTISPLFTAFGNGAPLILSTRSIPAMTTYDAVAAAVGQAIVLMPFLLGAQMLADEKGHGLILKGLAVAGLVYSIPMLLEIRLSPQLHAIIYGFLPHEFGQQMRDGGFRPMVFLGHGLVIAIFCAMTFLATLYCARKRQKMFGLTFAAYAAYLLIVLILCKSLGALVLALSLAPLGLLIRPRTIVLLSAIMGMVLLSYPALRGLGLVPVETISAMAGTVNDERQGSLSFRLENEDKLLAKASEKPVFGWGTWGRNRIYDGYNDSDSSVTDGAWIIIIGIYGWLGYLACYTLLCFPLIRQLRIGKAGEDVPLATAFLGLVLLINLIDSIPNSSISPLTWLIAGALSGQMMRRKQQGNDEQRPLQNRSSPGSQLA